jgi:hypothetical protein
MDRVASPTVRPSVPLWAIGVAVGLLAIGLGLPVGPTRPTAQGAASVVGGAAGSDAAPSLATGACPGSTVPGVYAASLGVEGSGAPAPSIANVNLSVEYYYTWNYSPSHGPSTLSCLRGGSTNVTGPSGTTTLGAPVPSTTCGSGGCSYYRGPYGPVSFSDPSGNPPGYFLTWVRTGSSMVMEFVEALSLLSLAPYGRSVVSVFAPTPIHGLPESGNGGPSPANLSYDWHLRGSGWVADGSWGMPTLTVTASPGAGPGSVALWTNGSYNGTAVSAGPVVLDLSAVATAISSGSVDPTSLDAEERTAMSVTGTGAAGYPYTAQFLPGLGEPPTNASCASTVVVGGILDLTCSATVTYAAPGLAQPSVNLTNGFSTASAALPTVTVAPALAVAISPASGQTYLNATTPLTVSAASGSGTPPYGPACLSTGDGRSYCSNRTGGPWTFDVTWGEAGTFGGVASVVDTAGVNRSVGFSIQVVDRPALDGILASSAVVDVGQNITLSSYVHGGAFPVSYWWNDSDPVGTVYAGAVQRSAPIVLRYSPTIGGLHNLTLTVLDSLGTRSSQLVRVVAHLGAPVWITTFGALPGASDPAGDPWGLSLVSVNGAGEPVPFDLTGESLSFSFVGGSPGGLTWVNDSLGSTAFDRGGNQSRFSLAVPPAAWSGGVLNVSVTPTRIGTLLVQLSGPLPIQGALSGRLSVRVTPDTGHLRLDHPRLENPGSRANSTLYRISDRFGNGAPGVSIIVRAVFGSTVLLSNPATEGNASSTVVWVNFSAPTDSSGTVHVEFAGPNGTYELLGPIEVPAAAAALALPWWLAGLGVVVLALGLGGYGYRRRRTLAALSRADPEVGEEELRRLAEGRAHVFSRARTDRPTELPELARGFPGAAPSGAELAEWVGSLVSEGALRAVVGPDGRPGFVRVPEPAAPRTLRIDVDPAVRDAALAAREESESPTDPPR